MRQSLVYLIALSFVGCGGDNTKTSADLSGAFADLAGGGAVDGGACPDVFGAFTMIATSGPGCAATRSTTSRSITCTRRTCGACSASGARAPSCW